MFPEKINNVTYDEFQRITKAIKEYMEFCDIVYGASNESLDLFETEPMLKMFRYLINMTEKVLNDELDTFDYFIYELDFGDKYNEKCEYDTGDGIVETPFRTVRDLWLYFALDNKIIHKETYLKLLEDEE